MLLQSKGEHGNVVNQMLIDPQWMDPQKDGVGMVAMLYFSEDGNQLAVEWISSDTGKYYKECNQFTLDLTDCFGAPDHTFSDSYDETHHYKACDCGYACDKEAHAFDNGETDANGDTKYTCDCGYVKVIPKKATATYVTLDGEVLDVVEVDVNADGLYYITAPTLDGYVAEYDRLILNPKHDSLNVTVYCSTVAVWDGVSVSSGLKGKGTEDDPFLIESGADLKYLADKVNAAPVLAKNFAAKHFKFTQSIDLNGHDIYIGHYPTGGEGWKYRKSLYSYIDGNHCTIRGLDQAGSVFGGIETGYLKNLSVYGSISAPTYEFVGGVVGYICNGTVLENLTSYVTINGKSGLGGIVGNSENMATDIVNCVNYGNVTGTAWNIGGIAGIAGHNVTNCVNYGNVIGGDNNIGGIAGETKLTGIISGCINYGSVTVTNTSKGKTGGVVGNAQKPVVGCINYGTVTGASIAEGGTVVDTTTGGICGTSTIKISNSINYGTINGTNTTGGIAGFSAGKVENCTNHGKVNATSWNIGGIAGRASANGISDCYNYGDVTTTSDAIGGIVGTAQSDIVNCENNGTVKGRANVGGIVGVGHKLISNCVNNGDVNANWDCGGILGKVTSSVVSVVDCINNGSVTATPNSKGEGGTGVGGIFGYISGGYLKITNCTNNGAVAGTWGVGGIAGNISIDTTISGCVNTGTLNAMGELGGIVGKCSGKVTGCTNKGIVSGTNSIIGGIVGNLHDTTYLNDITTTNKQESTVSGNGSQEIIGKQ